MTLAPLPGFAPFTTHHCVTGSMRRVYEFHDHHISEEMLLGLGAGVGFVYWHMKGTSPFLGGRANVGRPGEEGLEKLAGRRTGVGVEKVSTASAKKAEGLLLDLLASGQPAMIQVDMGYLPYFDFGGEYHFGGHVIVACGYDPATGQVLVADRDEKWHEVSLADLAQARGSRHKPFPPQNTLFAFAFAAKRAPAADEVRAAIGEVTAGMLAPPIANLGVKGIRTAAKRMLTWPREMNADELRLACFNVYIFVDAAGGTGGGCFRYMYSRFLREAATIVDDGRLLPVADALQAAGDRWQEAALLMKGAFEEAEPAARLPEASKILQAVAEQEEAAWQELRAVVG